MIYDLIENAHLYKGLCKNLDTALDFIKGCNPDDLKIGRNEIDFEEVFCNFMSVKSKKLQDALFEKHELYADIHVDVDGEEWLETAFIEDCKLEKPFDLAGDAALYKGYAQTRVALDNKKFCICFPQDVHRPNLGKNDVEEPLVKYVVKVKM